MALKFITFLRPLSGTTIELANTKEMKAFAKANGWKIKKEQPKVEIDNDDSGASGESDRSGDLGTSE